MECVFCHALFCLVLMSLLPIHKRGQEAVRCLLDASSDVVELEEEKASVRLQLCLSLLPSRL